MSLPGACLNAHEYRQISSRSRSRQCWSPVPMRWLSNHLQPHTSCCRRSGRHLADDLCRSAIIVRFLRVSRRARTGLWVGLPWPQVTQRRSFFHLHFDPKPGPQFGHLPPCRVQHRAGPLQVWVLPPHHLKKARFICHRARWRTLVVTITGDGGAYGAIT